MLRIFLIIFLCLGSFYSEAQVLSTSGTITDTDSQTWNGGSYKVQLYSPNGTAYYNGTLVPTAVQSGALSASGAFSGLSLYNTNTITPNGAQYSWTICSNTSALCSTFNTPVTSTDLSSALSALVSAPRFEASSKAYGYLDAEVTPTPSPGQGYFNVTSKTQRIWDGTQWIAGGGGTASVVLSQIPQNDLIGLYTYADCSNPYKDYSGKGNDGSSASPIAEPTCAANGLTFNYNNSTHAGNAWNLPTLVSTQGLTYIFSVLPLVTTTTGNNLNGFANQTLLQSTVASGGELSLVGSNLPGNTVEAWIPGMGLVNSEKTYASQIMPSSSVYAYYVGSNASTDKDTMFNNGAENIYTAQGATTLASFGTGTLQIGGNTKPFWGIQSVLLVYNRKLTSTENQQIAGVLNNYTNNRTMDVYPIPQSTYNQNVVVADGDSITCGVGVAGNVSWATLFTLGSIPFTMGRSTCTPGRTMAAQQARQAQDVIPQYSVNGVTNTTFLFAGTNDISAGISAADTWGYEVSAVKNARYGNSKIILMPMLDRSTLQTGKNALNALFNTQCALYADYCIAPDDPLLYADGASNNTTYFQGDKTHPTLAGQTLLATYPQNAWLQLYGSTEAQPTIVSTATYTVLAGDNYINTTANSVITLYNCLGYSKFISIKVAPALTVTVKNATTAQTIDGVDHSTAALALTANTTTKFQVVPGPTSTGGCTWITR